MSSAQPALTSASRRSDALGAAGRYWPLFVKLTQRELRQRYKGSALGVLWTLITPAVMVAVYSLVFHYVFKIDIANYWLFLVVGLSGWTLFFGSALFAAPSLVGNASLVTKVRFPRAIIPLSVMVGNSVTAFAMIAVAGSLGFLMTGGDREPFILLPLVLLLISAMALGLGLVVAAAQVYFRDVEHILGALGLPWVFLTPVFYTYDETALADHPTVVSILHWANPASPFTLALQDILYWGTWPSLGDMLYVLVAGPLVLGLGWWFFRRIEPEMAVEL